MDARKEILKSIGRHEIPSVDLPSLHQGWIHYEDRIGQFLRALSSVGGTGHRVAKNTGFEKKLNELDGFAKAKQVCSLVESIPSRGVELSKLNDPHDLADVDWAIIKGEFAVAENGAIWVTHVPSLHRALPFISQHLVIVVPVSHIVDNMHQAYHRIHFNHGQHHFGVFISGPSKTADIEQSLVIGAHGARSLNVFLVG